MRAGSAKVIGLIVLVAAFALPACTGAPVSRRPPQPEQDEVRRSADGVPVLMMGRSVMRGWFDHWGWDGQTPVIRDGHEFSYVELASPPDIATSAEERIGSAPEGSIIVFKLCFVDFEADSASGEHSKLTENLGYAERVVTAARERGHPVILGNALPRVAGETNADLVELHRSYNAALDALAANDSGVSVLDMYGVLTGDEGELSARYAVSAGDSHLSEAAYDALDTALFELLTTAGE